MIYLSKHFLCNKKMVIKYHSTTLNNMGFIMRRGGGIKTHISDVKNVYFDLLHMNIFQQSHSLKELLASSQNSGGINKRQSGCNEAGRVNDSSVSIVTKCVLAIGDLQRNRAGIMYPLPPPHQALFTLTTSSGV